LRYLCFCIRLWNSLKEKKDYRFLFIGTPFWGAFQCVRRSARQDSK
jgi:hypothetical protein